MLCTDAVVEWDRSPAHGRVHCRKPSTWPQRSLHLPEHCVDSLGSRSADRTKPSAMKVTRQRGSNRFWSPTPDPTQQGQCICPSAGLSFRASFLHSARSLTPVPEREPGEGGASAASAVELLVSLHLP